MENENINSDSLSESSNDIGNAVSALGEASQQLQSVGGAASSPLGVNAAEGAGTAGTSSAAAGASGAAGAATSTGAASGTAAGATMGAASGPTGAAVGAAVGALAKPVSKLLYVLLIMALILISVFCSLPGVIFRDVEDVLDYDSMMERYNEVVDPIIKKYQNQIMLDIQLQTIQDSVLTGQTIGMGYDSYEVHTTTAPPAEQMEAQLRGYANMIISMYEIRTKDWWISPIWLADFLRWLDTLFVDFVSIEKDVEVKESEINVGTEDEPYYERHADIYITYTVKDKGIDHFRKVYGLDDDQMEEAKYMAKNLAELVGVPNGSDEMGGSDMIDGIVTGGGTHDNIHDLVDDKNEELVQGNLRCPLDRYSYISSKYGYRDFPADPFHTGIDLAAPKDTPVKAAMDGTILYIANSPNGFGKHVAIYHGGKVTTMYAHMNKFGAIEVGQKVRAGDVIGYVGTTGLSTGNHLHFEYQIDGAPQDPNLYYHFY